MKNPSEWDGSDFAAILIVVFAAAMFARFGWGAGDMVCDGFMSFMTNAGRDLRG